MVFFTPGTASLPSAARVTTLFLPTVACTILSKSCEESVVAAWPLGTFTVDAGTVDTGLIDIGDLAEIIDGTAALAATDAAGLLPARRGVIATVGCCSGPPLDAALLILFCG
ncbi:MAG TPA: hypothetical protein ENI62_11785, partial [Gammaproteobacteria bacterium]|nr:hypothetical protein [Gammaproteobacteria bacterium]